MRVLVRSEAGDLNIGVSVEFVPNYEGVFGNFGEFIVNFVEFQGIKGEYLGFYPRETVL
jgi:hypothetical protein